MKHQVPVQLRFNDTDALGHVNNSTYFSFYDLGKSEYFATVRGNDNFFSQKVDIVVVQITFAETVSTVYFLYMGQNVRFRAACVNVDIAQKE